MIFQSAIVLAIICAAISIASFVLFVRARMKENKKAEKLYQSIHFVSLAVFVMLGLAILIIMSNNQSD